MPPGQPSHLPTVLVTGATGFLGSALCRRLLSEGYSVVAMKRSSSDLFRLDGVAERLRFYDIDRCAYSLPFEENRISAVLHCATNYGRRDQSPTEIIEANLTLPLHLLQICPQYGVHAFINSDTILDKRVSHYSLSKSQFCDWLKLFSPQLSCATIALEHFYGPLDDRSKFVTRMVTELLSGAPSIELTEGRQIRDFIYIDDAVDAFIKILAFCLGSNHGFYRFEVGSDERISIREFVSRLKRLSGNTATELRFGALPYRENEVMETRVDTQALRRLGWAPRIGLDQGLTLTLEEERKRIQRSSAPA